MAKKLIAANPVIQDKVDRLMAHLRLLNRGDTITFDKISKITGLHPYVGSWQTVIKKARRQLENERGITLDSVPPGIYELSRLDRQLSNRKRLNRAARQLHWDQREKNSIPNHELTPHQQVLRAQEVVRVRLAKLSVRRQVRANRADFTSRIRP